MAKLPNFRRLYSSDFEPDKKDLIDRLGTSLNNAIETLFDALNKKLTFRDNISATIVELSVTVNSGGVPNKPTSFKLDARQTIVEGLMVIDAVGTTDPLLFPTAGVFVSFTKNENIIIIRNVKGLQAEKPYTLKIIALG